MVVLKKIRASTLMETMVATVLIVVIFMLSSLILNSLFSAQVKNNLQPLKTHITKLEYQYCNQKIALPYFEEWQGWEITMVSVQGNSLVEIKAEELDASEAQIVKQHVYGNTVD